MKTGLWVLCETWKKASIKSKQPPSHSSGLPSLELRLPALPWQNPVEGHQLPKISYSKLIKFMVCSLPTVCLFFPQFNLHIQEKLKDVCPHSSFLAPGRSREGDCRDLLQDQSKDMEGHTFAEDETRNGTNEQRTV